MYHSIVKRNIRAAFDHLNKGDYEKVLAMFSPDIRFRFPGQHSLAANLSSLPDVRNWFEKFLSTLKGIQFEILDILVEGAPWNTIAMTRFRDTIPLPDGREMYNEGVQFLRIKWGKIVEDQLYIDTQIMESALSEIGKPSV
ncbi:nuclear transport factor 2 family protein [Paenibacillus beijingensis]|uniref:SnoaL-like domain-containing protein n=1 Tax=Paenibacillus beijingensis TaxID=1126833 RepID=A0A0D5NF79_9BACL|nr:nuclear transport factor 2 family protein [Paenibacillus beijingensis]AJY73795.1 hypothetical protein VN24_03065 [Paenibacillus beijingensis]